MFQLVTFLLLITQLAASSNVYYDAVNEISDRKVWFKDYDGGDTWNGVTIPAAGSSRQLHHNLVPYLRGTTATVINWGKILAPKYTICSLTRYSGAHQGRILTDPSVNWLHGHYGRSSGVAHYGGWNTQHTRDQGNTDWVIFCGQNDGDWIFRTNGKVNTGNGQKHNGIPPTVSTNTQDNSDFDIMEIITWSRALTSEEIDKVIDYYELKLGSKYYGEVSKIKNRKTWFKDYEGGNTWNGVSITATGTSRRLHNDLVYYLRGTTATVINWGDILDPTYTICSVTRYAGSNQNRILTGDGANWLHGHWDGNTGVAHYGGWNTPHALKKGNTDWVIFCGQNGGDWIFRTNGKTNTGNGQKNNGMPATVRTNIHEQSEFDIMEIITWSRALSSAEINLVIDYFEMKLAYRIGKKEYSLLGEGKCSDEKQQYWGANTDHVTIESCETYCGREQHSYFTLWEEHDTKKCSCFEKCEGELIDATNSKTFESISDTISTTIYECEAKLSIATDMERNCNRELANSDEELNLWKNRFQKVKQLEDDHRKSKSFAEQAIEAHPEASVGAANVNCVSTGNHFMWVERMLFFIMGCGFYGIFGNIKDILGEKTGGDNYNALANI